MKALRVALTDGSIHSYPAAWRYVRDDAVNKGFLHVTAEREDGADIKRVYPLGSVLYWEMESEPE